MRGRSQSRSHRFGRKAIACARMSYVLDKKPAQAEHKKFTLPTLPRLPRPNKKFYVIASLALVVMVVAGLGYGQYARHQDNVAKAAREVQMQQQIEASKRAETCRLQKVQEKADRLNALTYDELYEYNACTTIQ